ncbi:hypothetical protein [Azospirillum sp. TSO22-1]|uniref:hypothetical protein n=1 Tax=Azospirillum sp. TSO22-1 TaxID=716789 RepID=UPI0018EE7C8A|nr:hypothetical protein [Azospirillum sp. TSO22-1]
MLPRTPQKRARKDRDGLVDEPDIIVSHGCPDPIPKSSENYPSGRGAAQPESPYIWDVQTHKMW